jgi:hypothetical protein
VKFCTLRFRGNVVGLSGPIRRRNGRLRTPVVGFRRQLDRILREQLIRTCPQLSGRLLPAASQIYVRSHSHTCVTTGNLQTRQQMGTETHQCL